MVFDTWLYQLVVRSNDVVFGHLKPFSVHVMSLYQNWKLKLARQMRQSQATIRVLVQLHLTVDVGGQVPLAMEVCIEEFNFRASCSKVQRADLNSVQVQCIT